MILVRGGGDLASGVIYRLHRAGIRVLITELSQPLVVRRLAAFAEAVYRGVFSVEGVTAKRIYSTNEAENVWAAGAIPVLVDPGAECRHALQPLAIVDGRMTKSPPDLSLQDSPCLIGLGPGFVAGENCHAVIETNRGHWLGRVIWAGSAEADTGVPESVNQYQAERVLRAPAAGILEGLAEIGELLKKGQPVAQVTGQVIAAPFAGVLRGLLHPGVEVQPGMKIGDLDPRQDPAYCTLISDKALAVGGGVLEALLTQEKIRQKLWS
jgi:xanthine dehydrogenase accessory factor